MKPPPLPPTAAVQVKRSRPPVAAPAAPKAPSPVRPKAIRQTSANYNPPAEQSAASATPAPIAIPALSEKSGAASDPAADVDKLASAIKRITLRVSSRDEHDRKQKQREEAEKKKKAQGAPAAKKAGSSGAAKTLAVRKPAPEPKARDPAAETPLAAADMLQGSYSVGGAAVARRLGDGAKRMSGTREQETQQRASSGGTPGVVASTSVPDSVMGDDTTHATGLSPPTTKAPHSAKNTADNQTAPTTAKAPASPTPPHNPANTTTKQLPLNP
ncbi:hypothetical protein LTR28_002684, partial [Elasticomyces elasticus]